MASTSAVVLFLHPTGGQSAWHVAAREGHTEVLQALADGLRAAAAVTPLRQQKGFTDLGMTDDDVIEALVQVQDSKGLTALHLACIKGHAEATEVLMHLRANPFAMVREE
jgi:ankyrin repeat protein